MLSQQVLEAWVQRIEENASARITGNAKDITELTRRIETLVVAQAGNGRTFRELISDNAELACRVERLEQRHEGLVLAVAGLAKHEGRRTEELAERVEQLEEKQCKQWVEEVGMVNNLAQRLNTLAENEGFLAERLLSQKRRIEQLERLLERGQK